MLKAALTWGLVSLRLSALLSAMSSSESHSPSPHSDSLAPGCSIISWSLCLKSQRKKGVSLSPWLECGPWEAHGFADPFARLLWAQYRDWVSGWVWPRREGFPREGWAGEVVMWCGEEILRSFGGLDSGLHGSYPGFLDFCPLSLQWGGWISKAL